MNRQILLLMLIGFAGTSVKAGDAAEEAYFPGVPGEVQQLAFALVAQRDAADARAEDAEKLVAQLRPQAEEAVAKVVQLTLEVARCRENEDAVYEEASRTETELCQVTEDAEQLRRENMKLRKERDKANLQADDFLRRLQQLTDEHEAVTRAHGNAKRALEKVALEKKQSDDEVQRLRGEVGSLLDIDFRMQGVGMFLPRVNPKFSAMAVFNPKQFQQDQDGEKAEKHLKLAQLQDQLQEALGAQRKMQDSADEAFALVQEKDREIKVLSVQAVRLEQERLALETQNKELENFKDATNQGYCYLDEADVVQATAGAAAEAPQDEMPRIVRRGALQSGIEKLRKIVRAAIDEATS